MGHDMNYDSAQEVLSRVQDVTEFLGIHLVDVNQRGIFGNTPLAVVTSWGEVEAVSRLLEGGADVNAKNEDGYTALRQAVMFDDHLVVERLLEAKASVSIKNDEGDTPLDLAKRLGNDGLVSRLTT